MSQATVRDLTLLQMLTCVETLQGVPGLGTSQTVNNDQFNRGPSILNSTSAPPVSKVSYSQQTMTGSAVTVDLSNLPGTQDNIDGTGFKVNVLHLKNNGANSVIVAPGASNAYEMFGAGQSITLPPGAELTVKFNDNLGDIGPTAKNIDLTGTNGQTCDVMFGMG